MRDKSVDILKGILMIMVLFGHIPIAYNSVQDISNQDPVFEIIALLSQFCYAPFYMAAFFCITGYCSAFKRPMKEQIINDIRKLIIPAFIIPLVMKFIFSFNINKEDFMGIIKGNTAWFLFALFHAKIIFKFVNEIKVDVWMKWTIYIALSLMGVIGLCKFESYNLISFFHGLSFAIFVSIGHKVRGKMPNSNYIYFVAFILYCITVAIVHWLLKIHIPSLCAVIAFQAKYYLIFLFLASLGTLFAFGIAKWINNNIFFEYFGRNSLIIYVSHFPFLMLLPSLFRIIVPCSCNRIVLSASLILIMMIGTILWSVLCAKLFNLKYLRWIIGK